MEDLSLPSITTLFFTVYHHSLTVHYHSHSLGCANPAYAFPSSLDRFPSFEILTLTGCNQLLLAAITQNWALRDGQSHLNSKMESITDINMLPDVNLAQIFEKLPCTERLKIERVCKKWQYVGKNLSWSNYRIFDNKPYKYWREHQVMQVKPFFERCGRHLRHLTLRKWSSQAVLSFIGMSPNVQHLSLLSLKLDGNNLRELAQLLPNLKSLYLEVPHNVDEGTTDYDLGLIECFKAMTCLEYLYFQGSSSIFRKYKFVKFPAKLRYLGLYFINNSDKILRWVAKGCKDLRALNVNGSLTRYGYNAIAEMKSLTYLRVISKIDGDIGFMFEALSELRALEIDFLDEMVVAAIARHCQKLEHLKMYFEYKKEISPEKHANMLRLSLLPNLCSLEILAAKYSKEQTTEFVNRLIAKGIIQYISMYNSEEVLEPEILLEMLRRCKNIRSIDLNVGGIDSELFSKIRQVVDEIDEGINHQSELPKESHPIVEVQYDDGEEHCCHYMVVPEPYKWFRFVMQMSPSPVCDKWEYGWLSAGKLAWLA
ncbi:hypothetical protein Ddc_18538 [Ditylenchus destructor]|nr:hypothetical protein Ddc_18538 [Ditylenchus destructor]